MFFGLFVIIAFLVRRKAGGTTSTAAIETTTTNAREVATAATTSSTTTAKSAPIGTANAGFIGAFWHHLNGQVLSNNVKTESTFDLATLKHGTLQCH